jgi:hypothetical protein
MIDSPIETAALAFTLAPLSSRVGAEHLQEKRGEKSP